MKNVDTLRLHKKNITDFAKERNELLKKAKSDWVLFLDSDEVLSKPLKKEIDSLDPKSFSGFVLKRKIYFLGKLVGQDKVLRLAKKNSGVWKRKVHETWDIKGRIGTLKNPIIHNTATSLEPYIRRLNKYSDIHAKENINEGKIPGLFKIIFYPKLKFLQNIILGRGVVFSILQSFHSFLGWAKAWEIKKPIKARREAIENFAIFPLLAIFPFGQLVRFKLNLLGYEIPLLPIDIMAGVLGLYGILRYKKRPLYHKYLVLLFIAILFSFITFIPLFGLESFYGLFYVIRLAAYLLFAVYIWNYVGKSSENRKVISNSILAVSAVSAFFGWIQLFSFPDIKPFFVYNWDMHLFRLVGTFLDPTFLGLIIAFGLFDSINRFTLTKKKGYILLGIFLLISLAFTYSRASFLAFFAGVMVLAAFKKAFKPAIILITSFLVLAFLLPTSRNHSIEIFRQFSALARIENYKNTIQIFKNSPVLGIGYNNMCAAYQKYIGYQDFASHACSGSDSSILFILATTGVVGLLIFINTGLKIVKLLKKTPYYPVFIASVVALLVHSLFSNSIFYPFIMAYMATLLALAS